MTTSQTKTPYCGNVLCPEGVNSRTTLINDQFECTCGWRSEFDGDMLNAYLDLSDEQSEAYTPDDARSGTAGTPNTGSPA